VGLTPGKDVTIVQIGSTTARVDAALSGRVQATVVQPTASIIAQKKGMTILGDLPKLGLVYQHASAATTRRYIREHSDIVRRYVKPRWTPCIESTPIKKLPLKRWRIHRP
jgi:ABC-type nitrate/sulfonate/bicarbonate transport system substrate-binding protein